MERKYMHTKVSRQTILISVCSVMRLRFRLLVLPYFRALFLRSDDFLCTVDLQNDYPVIFKELTFLPFIESQRNMTDHETYSEEVMEKEMSKMCLN